MGQARVAMNYDRYDYDTLVEHILLPTTELLSLACRRGFIILDLKNFRLIVAPNIISMVN